MLTQTPPDIDVVTLERLLSDITRRWPALLLGALVGAVLGLVYLGVATPKYTAEMVIAPVIPDSPSGARLGGLGSLGAIAGGLGLGGRTDTLEFQKYMELMQSRAIAARIADDQGIMRRVFHKEWNPSSRQWEPPSGVVSGIKQSLAGFGIESMGWSPPDDQRLQDWFDDKLKVREDPEKPFVRVLLSHEDPELALTLLRRLYGSTDGSVRRAAITRSANRITYIRDQIQRQTLAEHREALAGELGTQERTRILASSNAPFAAELVEPISVSARPTQPVPALSIGIGIGLGIIGGAGLALLLGALARRRARRAALVGDDG